MMMRGTRRRFWQYLLASFGLGVVAGMVILVKLQEASVASRPIASAGAPPPASTK